MSATSATTFATEISSNSCGEVGQGRFSFVSVSARRRVRSSGRGYGSEGLVEDGAVVAKAMVIGQVGAIIL